MRYTSVFIILLFIALNQIISPVYARYITKSEAILVANNKIFRLSKATDFKINFSNEIKKDNNTIAFQIDLVPKGYIIINANTDLPPIHAYSFESNFGELDENNPLYSILITDITNRTKFVSETNIIRNNKCWEELLDENFKQEIDTTFQQWPGVGNGWLQTNWTQNSPYNDFCPIDPVTNQRSIAGCPSVAMAQILNFHKTTNSTYFDNSDDYYHNYAGRQYWIDNDYIARGFPSFPELNNYLDTLNLHYFNNIQPTNADKASLTFACGIAATQVYTSGGSGTFSVNQAYDAYQRFNCTTTVLLDTLDIDLFPRLIQNIKDTLPAHLAIVNQTSTSGHNVVVDGYNTDDYFHLNFGWGGSYNGWYLIPQEIPYSLTFIEGVVLDIMKNPLNNVTNPKKENISICVFPNPFSSHIEFVFLNNSVTNVRVDIFDITGKIVLSENIKANKSENSNINIKLDNINEGIYFYKLNSANGIYTGKLIKN